MTNQTMVFSVFDVSGNIADVSARVNTFVKNGLADGYSNFHIQPVVVTPSATANKFWFTVQVNYYNPVVQEG